jgi:hypothetical protein
VAVIEAPAAPSVETTDVLVPGAVLLASCGTPGPIGATHLACRFAMRHHRPLNATTLMHVSSPGRIADAATRSGAALIVLNVRHGTVDRLVDLELASSVIRRTSVPVLVVAPGPTQSMQSLVIASDGGPASSYVAHLARALGSDDASVRLLRGAACHTAYDIASTYEADLVAIDTNSRGCLETPILQTIADSLVWNARCSVLVVPPAHGEAVA